MEILKRRTGERQKRARLRGKDEERDKTQSYGQRESADVLRGIEGQRLVRFGTAEQRRQMKRKTRTERERVCLINIFKSLFS